MYVIGSVDQYGYAFVVLKDGSTRCIHRDTRNVHFGELGPVNVYDFLDDAKKAWAGPGSEQMILALDSHGGGKEVWVARSDEKMFLDRLKRFKGCYGTWPVKLLNP